MASGVPIQRYFWVRHNVHLILVLFIVHKHSAHQAEFTAFWEKIPETKKYTSEELTMKHRKSVLSEISNRFKIIKTTKSNFQNDTGTPTCESYREAELNF